MIEFLNFMTNLIFTFWAVLIGGIITWAISWKYYERASKELKIEAQKLAKLQNITLHALEYFEGMEFNKSSDGKEFKGIHLEDSASDTVHTSDHGEPD